MKILKEKIASLEKEISDANQKIKEAYGRQERLIKFRTQQEKNSSAIDSQS